MALHTDHAGGLPLDDLRTDGVLILQHDHVPILIKEAHVDLGLLPLLEGDPPVLVVVPVVAADVGESLVRTAKIDLCRYRLDMLFGSNRTVARSAWGQCGEEGMWGRRLHGRGERPGREEIQRFGKRWVSRRRTHRLEGPDQADLVMVRGAAGCVRRSLDVHRCMIRGAIRDLQPGIHGPTPTKARWRSRLSSAGRRLQEVRLCARPATTSRGGRTFRRSPSDET